MFRDVFRKASFSAKGSCADALRVAEATEAPERRRERRNEASFGDKCCQWCYGSSVTLTAATLARDCAPSSEAAKRIRIRCLALPSLCLDVLSPLCDVSHMLACAVLLEIVIVVHRRHCRNAHKNDVHSFFAAQLQHGSFYEGATDNPILRGGRWLWRRASPVQSAAPLRLVRPGVSTSPIPCPAP